MSADKEIINTIYRAREIAVSHKHEFVTLEHMLAASLEEKSVIDLLTNLNVDADELRSEVEVFLETDFIPVLEIAEDEIDPHRTDSVDELITRTVAEAIVKSRGSPTTVDLLLTLVQMPHQDSFAVTLLLKCGITLLSLRTLLSHGPDNKRFLRDTGEGTTQAGSINTPAEAEALLELYCRNLNKAALASKIDPLIGRELEVDALVQVLARRTKNNAVLVGEAGVGKTSIAEGLALKIVRKEVPEVIEDSTIFSLDIGALVAGTRFRGDFEERMKQVLKSLELIPGSILFIDEIHTVIGAGSGTQGSMDVGNLLKPALATGLRCIGSTTLEEYRKHFEKDRALHRRFKKIDIGEPTIEDTKLILMGLRSYYEEFHNVKFSDEALCAAVELTNRYVTNAFLPDKAIDIIDNAGARQRVAKADVRKIEIGIHEIEVEVAKVAHIPAKTVAEDESAKLIHLESDLKANVIGQDAALLELVDAVFMSRAGLRETNKPAGSYLFAGPTGVGKSEAARTLAKTLGVPLLKYDMSEYMEKHAVSKLIGAPPGYVGYGEGNAGAGKLTNDVDTHPYAVVLFDEIEKAHPDVMNIFLQIMDDGKLTNSGGKVVSFRNVIIIMTSNAGAVELEKNNIGFGRADNTDSDEPIIKKTFSPEFRNRLDAIVKFGRLKPENILVIVDKFIAQLGEMTANRNVTLELGEGVSKWLGEKGYDKLMGARPLQRVIADNIKKPLARLMVTGALAKGGVAKINLVDNKIVVTA